MDTYRSGKSGPLSSIATNRVSKTTMENMQVSADVVNITSHVSRFGICTRRTYHVPHINRAVNGSLVESHQVVL